jgi:hypothetical protein
VADTKKFRLEALFKATRNNTNVVVETVDTGTLDYTDGNWNELQLATSANWVELPFNIDMTGFNHMFILSDQPIGFSENSSGVGAFYGTVMTVSGTGASSNVALYIQNNSSFTANIRYALVT